MPFSAGRFTVIVFSGTAAHCPDLRFIFSRAGGALTFLMERMITMPVLDPKLASWTRLLDVSQILFGSDYPYRTGADPVKGLREFGFSASDLRAIERDNARHLLPRWKS